MNPHSKDTSMKQHIEECQASGLSQRSYCRQHNIAPHILSYYRKKLGYVISKSSSNNNQLIPINLLAEAVTSKPVRISHTNGFSLEIMSDSDLNQFKPILELLGSIQ